MDRTKRTIGALALAAGALLAAAAPAGRARAGVGDGWGYFDIPHGGRKAVAEGTASTPSGRAAAELRVQCHPTADGALCIAFKVEGAKSVSGFDFDIFEGPDAAARGKTLLRAKAGASEVASSVEGSYNKEGAFLFEMCASNRGPSSAATLARALAAGGAAAEVSVAEPDHPERVLHGEFPADVADGAVSRALHGCLKD